MLDAPANTRVSTPQHDVADSLVSSVTPCGGNAPPRWCVVYTHPQAEAWASQNLTRLGFVCYLPTMTVTRRDRATRTISHTIRVPLFSRYLFVQQDNPALWRPIREAPGVSSVITAGDQIQYASAGAVEALQATEAVRAIPLPKSNYWAPGVPCSLGKGYVLGGLPAVVLAVSRNRIRIGVMFLGQMTTAHVPPECLVTRETAP